MIPQPRRTPQGIQRLIHAPPEGGAFSEQKGARHLENDEF